MKYSLLLSLLFSVPVFAKNNIACSDFQGSNYRHYLVQIDTKNNIAVVDTIGTRSTLDLNDIGFLESLPPQKVYRFSGSFKGSGTGTWKAFFNETKMYVGLRFINTDGREVEIGQSSCEAVR